MSEHYDVIVIGAGIHGAGVAQAAAAQGYRVLLLEQCAQAACATSSKSSKLIHGGLRYLESAQFALVKECLRERALLLKNAPHLVKLKPFYIPVYRNTSRRPWQLTAGMLLYSWLSGRSYHRVQKHHWPLLDGLTTDGLDAVFCYYDAQTDDARLTRAVLSSAQSLGTQLKFATHVLGANYRENGIELHTHDEAQGQRYTGRIVINASGPWADKLHNKLVANQPAAKLAPSIVLVQGAHIILPGEVSHPYYLEAPLDKRAVFVLPWQYQGEACVLVGTTETAFNADPAEVSATTQEIDYLLNVYNHYFRRSYRPDDMRDSFAGLRVLPAGEGAAFGKSRDTVFARDNDATPRVVSIHGGNLTAYRATAEKLITSLQPHLPKRQAIANTRRLMLPMVD